MPKHEQYEELSTLAMIGEASAVELKELKDHLEHCSECRQEYFEFVQFVLPQLSLAADSEPIQELTLEDRATIRSDFLAKAQKAGVRFSDEALAKQAGLEQPAQLSQAKSPSWWTPWFRYGLAAGLAIVLVAGSFFFGRKSASTEVLVLSDSPQAKPVAERPALPISAAVQASAPTEAETAKLQKALNEMLAKFEQAKAGLDTADDERATLRAEIERQKVLLKEALRESEDQTQTSEQARASLQSQLEQMQQKESALETDYANQTAAVVDLADKLKQQKAAVEQQRQLASTDSEVHDLMASRNLHIVDVFDTDTRGKTKPIFGRVFFAENKQLVFYAYDLSEVQGRDTKIDYHVWGQKEGPGHSAKSLGVFRADDKSQQRWVFKSDDEQLLTQIDSIFVTIERSDSPKSEPKGQKLMYAYLRDRPNHP